MVSPININKNVAENPKISASFFDLGKMQFQGGNFQNAKSPKSKNDLEIVWFSAPFLFIFLGDTIKIGGQVGAHGFLGPDWKSDFWRFQHKNFSDFKNFFSCELLPT